MLDPIVRVKPPGGSHGVGGTAALRLARLFVVCLSNADVLDDGRQDLLGVIAQLRLGHIRAWRHQCLREYREFADDFIVVVADEGAQGH